jgi:hypothetical protein
MPSKLMAAVAAASLALALAAPAYAFDCFVAKKPPRAGAVGVVDVTTDEFTPLKPNPGTDEKPHGAFIALAVGDEDFASTFLHAPAHTGGVLPPVANGVQNNCDGKGLDSLEACFPE